MDVPFQELRKQLEDEQLQADITHAVNCIQNVLDFANEAIHKEHLAAAVVDLSERVDDWKALKMESFGDLLRFGTFQVVKGDSGKDSEREVCKLAFCVLCFLVPRNGTLLTLPLVPYLSLRAHTPLLQRYQSQQAKVQAYDAKR